MSAKTKFCAVAIAVAFFCAPAAPKPVAAQTTAKTASTSPQKNLPLIGLDEYKALLGKYRGKPILVNMWATWCEPCRAEYPALVSFAREYQPKGLVVIGVSYDDDADMNLVRRFLAKNNPDFRNYRQKHDELDEFIRGVSSRWDGSLPATLIYDRQGNLVQQFVGGTDAAQWRPAVQPLLGK